MMNRYGNVEMLIGYIKKRPGMYIAELRIDYLYHLLWGYRVCRSELGYADEIDFIFKTNFPDWVRSWINENTENDNSNELPAFWYKIIQRATDDNEKALELFFEISEAFFKKYHQGKITPKEEYAVNHYTMMKNYRNVEMLISDIKKKTPYVYS